QLHLRRRRDVRSHVYLTLGNEGDCCLFVNKQRLAVVEQRQDIVSRLEARARLSDDDVKASGTRVGKIAPSSLVLADRHQLLVDALSTPFTGPGRDIPNLNNT